MNKKLKVQLGNQTSLEVNEVLQVKHPDKDGEFAFVAKYQPSPLGTSVPVITCYVDIDEAEILAHYLLEHLKIVRAERGLG